MTENMIGIIVCVLMVAGSAGLWIWSIWRRKKIEASYPKVWIHVGLPPPKGVEKALEVIKGEMPTWTGRYGGTIEWVKDPFNLPEYGAKFLAAGVVDDFAEPRIRLMWNADLTKTAIAHEIHHVWQARYEKNKIVDGDPLLYAWVYATNVKIRAAIV